MTNPADFATWLATNPTPSLQTMVAQYGSWGAIPAEAWTKWDNAVSAWENARRDRLLGSRTWAMMEARKLR
jgi:hypothetical protein